MILAQVAYNDWLVCQITSNPYGDDRAIRLSEDDFATGSLEIVSYARPGKLFTASADLVANRVGTLKAAGFNRLIDAVARLLDDNRR